jgi:hypothetical protein
MHSHPPWANDKHLFASTDDEHSHDDDTMVKSVRATWPEDLGAQNTCTAGDDGDERDAEAQPGELGQRARHVARARGGDVRAQEGRELDIDVDRTGRLECVKFSFGIS